MSKVARTYSATSLAGGMVVDVDPQLLSPGFTPDCSDVFIEDGTVTRRRGHVAFGSTTSTQVEQLLMLDKFDGNSYVVAIDGTGAFKYNTTSGAWSSLSATFTQTPVSAVSFNDTVVVSDGAESIQQWTGTGAASTLACTYKADWLDTFENRLLLLGTVESGTHYPNRMRWSDLGTYDAWSSAGYADLLETPGAIVGSTKIGAILCIVKEDAIVTCSYVGGTSVFQFDTRVTGLRFRAPKGIVNIGDTAIIIGDDNIYRYNAGLTAEGLLNGKLLRHIFSAVNKKYLSTATAFHMPSRSWVLFALPKATSTTPSEVWVWDYKRDVWFPWTIATTAMGVVSRQVLDSWNLDTETWDSDDTRWNDSFGEVGAPTLLLGDTSGVTTMFDFIAQDDNGTTITGEWQTNDIVYADQRFMRFLKLTLRARGEQLSAYYSTDEGVSWTHIDDVTLTRDWSRHKLDIHVTSRRIRFKFSGSSVWSLRAFHVDYIPRGDF